MNQLVDVATRETIAFLASRLAPRSRVLEVGCGEGHVALALRELGHNVLGLEADEETVERAQRLAAPVVQARWPNYGGPAADAIIFTRSLHHIGALEPAVDRARRSLAPGGAMLIEDFAFERADEATLAWFSNTVLRTHRSDLDEAAPGLGAEMLNVDDAAACWREHHEHVHAMSAMTQAIADAFRIAETLSAPYLYRYLVPALPATPAAASIVQCVLEDEAARGASGAITLIGARIVAFAR